MQNDLVHQVSMFLETHPLVIFAVAKVYKGKPANREEAKADHARWTSRGVFDKDIEDFALDVLSGRVSLETTLVAPNGIKWRIYGQGKFSSPT